VSPSDDYDYLMGSYPATSNTMRPFFISLGFPEHRDGSVHVPRWLDLVHDAYAVPGKTLVDVCVEKLPEFQKIVANLDACEVLHRLGGTAAVLAWVGGPTEGRKQRDLQGDPDRLG
jgi:hypothetical protein